MDKRNRKGYHGTETENATRQKRKVEKMSKYAPNDCVCEGGCGLRVNEEIIPQGHNKEITLRQVECKACGRRSVRSENKSEVIADWNLQTAASDLLEVCVGLRKAYTESDNPIEAWNKADAAIEKAETKL